MLFWSSSSSVCKINVRRLKSPSCGVCVGMDPTNESIGSLFTSWYFVTIATFDFDKSSLEKMSILSESSNQLVISIYSRSIQMGYLKWIQITPFFLRFSISLLLMTCAIQLLSNFAVFSLGIAFLKSLQFHCFEWQHMLSPLDWLVSWLVVGIFIVQSCLIHFVFTVPNLLICQSIQYHLLLFFLLSIESHPSSYWFWLHIHIISFSNRDRTL